MMYQISIILYRFKYHTDKTDRYGARQSNVIEPEGEKFGRRRTC